MTKTTQLLEGAVIRGAQKPGYDGMLTAEAIAFVADLERKFGPERRRLLARRAEIQRRLAVPELSPHVFRGLAGEPGVRGVLCKLIELLELDPTPTKEGRASCAHHAAARVCVA